MAQVLEIPQVYQPSSNVLEIPSVYPPPAPAPMGIVYSGNPNYAGYPGSGGLGGGLSLLGVAELAIPVLISLIPFFAQLVQQNQNQTASSNKRATPTRTVRCGAGEYPAPCRPSETVDHQTGCCKPATPIIPPAGSSGSGLPGLPFPLGLMQQSSVVEASTIAPGSGVECVPGLDGCCPGDALCGVP